MKRIKGLLAWMLAIGLTIFSCKKEDQTDTSKNAQGTVQFSLGGGEAITSRVKNSAESETTTSVENVSSILITIKDSEGTTIKEKEEITLFNFSGQYISDPLSLPEGTYTIEEFLVIDDSNDVVYATPLANSSKASSVITPLPTSFTVFNGGVTKTTMQVLDIEGISPDEFGYATFDFEVVETVDFYVNAFIYDSASNSLELDSLEYIMFLNNDSIYVSLLHRESLVSFPKVDSIYRFEFYPFPARSNYEMITEFPVYSSTEEYGIYTSKNPLKLIFVKN